MSTHQDTTPPQNQLSDDQHQHPQTENDVSQQEEPQTQEVPKDEQKEQEINLNQEGQNGANKETETSGIAIETNELQKSEEKGQINQGQNEQSPKQENSKEQANEHEHEQRLNGAQNNQNTQPEGQSEEIRQQNNEISQNQEKEEQSQNKHEGELQPKQANEQANVENSNNEETIVQRSIPEDHKAQTEEPKQQNGKQQKKEQIQIVEEVEVDPKSENRVLESERKVLRESLQSKYLINQPRDEPSSLIEEKIDKEQTQPLTSAPTEKVLATAPVPLQIDEKNQNHRQSNRSQREILPQITDQNRSNKEKPSGKDPRGCGECSLM